ncbi:ABC transporter permease [Microbacterium sp. AGC85]
MTAIVALTADEAQSAREQRARRQRIARVRAVALRVMRMVGVLFVVSVAAFSLVVLLPGDPVRVILGEQATPEQVAHLTAQLGLDRPLWERYLDWVGGMLRGDFGQTLLRPVRPVADLIGAALPVTLELAVIALVLGLAGGIALGALAAYRRDSAADRIINGASFALISLPAFVLALLLTRLFVFDIQLVRTLALAVGALGTVWGLVHWLRRRADEPRPWWLSIISIGWPIVVGALAFFFLPAFPREGWVPITEDLGGNVFHATLPSIVLALGLMPLYAQLLRADLIQTLRQNFVTIARSKGMPPREIVLKEALRPSLFGLITVAGISIGSLVGGTVIVETIFGLPGLGRLLVTSIQAKDMAVVQAAVLVAAALFLLINVLVDITYSFLDPRLRRVGR